MTPERAALDRALARVGLTVQLQRITGTIPNQTITAATVPAIVRAVRAQQVIGTIKETDSNVTLSPSDIEAAGWPGGTPPTDGTDSRVPKTSDRVKFNGRTCIILVVKPLYVRGELARIDLQVRG